MAKKHFVMLSGKFQLHVREVFHCFVAPWEGFSLLGHGRASPPLLSHTDFALSENSRATYSLYIQHTCSSQMSRWLWEKICSLVKLLLKAVSST